MGSSHYMSLTCIKSNGPTVVKPVSLTRLGSALFTFFSLFLFIQTPLWGAQSDRSARPPSTQNSNTEDDDLGPLPDIAAKTYPVKVIRRSSSNKIYLFEDPTNRQPKVGRILLLKREDELFMAFRVLKTYPDQKAIAAKRIRRYRKHRVLENDEPYLALEKLGDLNTPNTPEDNEGLAELEGKEKLHVLPFDPELDAGTPAQPEPEEETQASLAIEETQPIDHNLQWLTLGFGYFRNNAPPTASGSYFFAAANLRYGVTLARLIFLNKKNLQDSLAVEGGLYFYKTLNYVIQGDAYTNLAYAANLRYNLLFGESFGIFVYLGMAKNNVIASSQGQAAGVNALSSYVPLGGMGFLFQIGPNWYTRVDIGIDTIGLNLLLRF